MEISVDKNWYSREFRKVIDMKLSYLTDDMKIDIVNSLIEAIFEDPQTYEGSEVFEEGK